VSSWNGGCRIRAARDRDTLHPPYYRAYDIDHDPASAVSRTGKRSQATSHQVWWPHQILTQILSMARFLIILGLVLVMLGAFWPLFSRIGLGRLPGDIVIERGRFRLYVPLASALLLSLMFSIVLWLLNH